MYGQKLNKKGDKARGKASYYHSKFNNKKTASGEIYHSYKLTCAHMKLPYGTYLKVTNLRNRKSIVVKVNDRGPYSKNRIVDLSFTAASKIDMIRDGVVDVEIEIVSLPDANTTAKKDEDKKESTKDAKASNTRDKAKTVTKATSDKKTDTTVKKTTDTKKDSSAKTSTATTKSAAKPFVAGKTYSVWGTEQKTSNYGIQIASFVDLDEALDIAKEANGLGLKPIFIQCGWANGKKIYRLLYGSYKTTDDAKQDVINAKRKGFKGCFVKKHF